MAKKTDNIHDIDSKRPSIGIYVLPNLFTTAGLFAGFYAIMQSRLGHFEAACLGIYVAMIMDMLDGRLARLTNTMSEFGSEYDSLADMVSFGVAPALVMYEWALYGLGKVGGFAAFVFIACAALRLARFNVQTQSDKKHFIGLPSPAAAAIIVSSVWLCSDYKVDPQSIKIVLCVLTLLTGLAMVSNLNYRSFKDVNLKDKMPFVGLIILVFTIAVISVDPPIAFFVIGILYLLSGPLGYALEKSKSQKESK